MSLEAPDTHLGPHESGGAVPGGVSRRGDRRWVIRAGWKGSRGTVKTIICYISGKEAEEQ